MEYKVGDYVEITSGNYSWHRANPNRIFIGKIVYKQNNGLYRVFIFDIYSKEDKWLYSEFNLGRILSESEVLSEVI